VATVDTPRAKTTPARQAVPRKQTATVDDAALRAEVALLARARRALQQNATARAHQVLDQHRSRFARGTLAPEAAALRIEALFQQGAFEQAEAKTAAFMRAYPNHPLHTHVARLAQAHRAATPSQ
jgi:outer membrane protein assembly factor BamD (BamD/ComL family)